jgi:5-hydroxyisourate hydrolase-like protein (transthyretin family)
VRRFVLVAIVVGALSLLAAPRAAADYSVVQCEPGGTGVNYAEATWTPFGSTGFSIWGNNECTPGRPGLRLDTTYGNQGTGYTGNGSGLAWRFTAPPGTLFASVTAVEHYGDDGGFAAAAFSNGNPPFDAYSKCSPNPGDCWAAPTAAGATIFEVRLQCFRDPNCHSDWAYVWTTNFNASVEDGAAPTISAGGSLLSGDVVRGNQSLQATATDFGGGVRSIYVNVNGLRSKTDNWCPPDYAGQYTHLKPCPDSVTRQLSIDTQNDPGWTNGPNDIEICSTDAAGNVSPSCVRRTVQVDNSCPGSGGTAAAKLDAGADLGGRLTDRAAITSNQEPVIRGALRDGSGSAVSGATVCIYETIDLPDASRELVTTVTTQANGRFATRLDPGPSRDLDLVYRYNDRVLTDAVAIDSSVVPTFALGEHSLSNGHTAHFSGWLPGPNADGRAVALQARVGRKWRTFKQLRTDSDGRFRGKYRFTQTIGFVRYVFRALVKRQSGYPYEPGASRKRKVAVRG